MISTLLSTERARIPCYEDRRKYDNVVLDIFQFDEYLTSITRNN